MSDFLTWIELGFRHITDVNGADHILFLLALAAVYTLRDWRGILWTVTAFTVGHSVTLALSVTHVLHLPTGLIEFLIPVTIALTALGNIVTRPRPGSPARAARRPLRDAVRPVFAGVFGLVHGAGFANYLQSLFVERIALPLFGFNVGIEFGQVVVLALAFVAFVIVDRLGRALQPAATRFSPVRLRTVMVSLVVGVVATGWAVDRL